jgi:hypothetical protein
MRPGVCILVLSLLVFSCATDAGCMSSKSPAGTTVVPSPATRIATRTTVSPAALPTTPPASPAAVAVTPAATMPAAVPTPVATPNSDYYSAANANVPDNPWMENLEFTRSYYPFVVPDCGMREILPEVAQDPGYGIRQPVPKLIALSPGRMDAFLQKYDNVTGSAGCAAASTNPGWNFIKIEGTVIPRNARPSDYDMGIVVWSRGRVIAQLSSTETLTLEKPFTFQRYVPLRTDEMDLFESIGLVFYKKI